MVEAKDDGPVQSCDEQTSPAEGQETQVEVNGGEDRPPNTMPWVTARQGFFPAPSPRASESVPTSSAITWVGIGWLEGVSCFKN